LIFLRTNIHLVFVHILEHQLAQHQRNQTATINISDLFEDNELDKIRPISQFLIIL
jgi:hypothetical protein